jgi:hypothetical protein
MGLFRRRKERQPDADAYSELRQQVLQLTPDQLGDEVAEGPLVALLMETGYPEAVATLVAVADGTTSLYFSDGGGVVGAGEHAMVADANRRLLEVTGSFLFQLSDVSDPSPPAEGLTQFVAVTRDGLRGAGAPEEELGEGQHALSQLFYAGQDVITQIRLLEGG